MVESPCLMAPAPPTPSHLALDEGLQGLLQLDHFGGVLLGGEEQAELQVVGLGHHLAHQLIVGEHRSPAQGTIVVDALPPDRELRKYT